MDPRLSEMSTAVNGFKLENGNFSSSLGQLPYLDDGINHDLGLDDFDIPFFAVTPEIDSFGPSSTTSYETRSPDDLESDEVLKFFNQILVEENTEEKFSMFHDPLALRDAEKSLYEVIGQKYPPSPYNTVAYINQTSDSPESIIESSSGYSTSSNTGNSSMHPQLINIFSNSDSILQFKKGMEEASKFLPINNHLIIDLEKYALPEKSDDITHSADVVAEQDEAGDSSYSGRGRKHNFPEDKYSERLERSSKQSATSVEEVELSEYFEKVLLCSEVAGCGGDAKSPIVEKPSSQEILLAKDSNLKSRGKKSDSDGETVDLRTLLISCAQSVAADDRRTAYEQLMLIDQHSSPTGDAYQRLAHVFATGLRARLCGTGTELYASLSQRKISAFEKLKAYQVYLCACPFKKLPMSFANMMIGSALADASKLHIVDFGILYGFQWPAIIQCLSLRPGGPPKLRITGVELPQPGFKPEERVMETGRRLKNYCDRFGVSFEYQAIVRQSWESIKLEDFKIASDEVLAVNCLFRFGRLLDETVIVDSPRDALLKLIRKMKPDLFVNAVISGSYSAPFFVTRFKEALFHYSALFDMFDANIPRDSPERMDFEQEFLGREVMNVIACEGAERVERPETYKQWHARHVRAGFKPLPLNRPIMEKLRGKCKAGYHRDFLFDEGGNWMLLGWKGRIICASSCWVPS
ncbi:hypothetical protein M569_12158 [Genlisea aurea]|uniref:Uncharacterized protein n=1 Tax=Genlisea aurea TaxID=192259 RepID=S8C768_9LAMI|nr:hypothetical protein M569_12158 [Genlisea aurea]